MNVYAIKPLAWREATVDGVYYAETDTPFGMLTISPRASGLDFYWDCDDDQGGGIKPTIEAAKNAAEAYCRAKMLEGLEPVEVQHERDAIDLG